ncbi:hypothetical protein BN13_1210017 [Nostocoides jenkinsii Ben 74]|uniref:Uncharacterized protein n=1 Tax=Nostocoides jenkinsii Ben 74 TaxID=1193518 RepID=A0A077M5C2_9MICO|nr:hypothetical protein BN13_1210017 [Tetrasphaera jenkinsii Ben 74]
MEKRFFGRVFSTAVDTQVDNGEG